MPRPRTRAGELGSIQLTTLANGRIRARLHMRDDAGAPHHPQATGATEAEAIANVRRRAAELSTGASEEMCADTTVAQACSVWLAEVRAAGRIEVSSVEAYEDTVRLIVVPTCGALRLEELTVGRCDRIVRKVLDARSASAARKLRGVLSQVCGSAVRQGALATNPIRDIQKLPNSPKKKSYLAPEQIAVVRKLIHAWRADGTPGGPRPDVAKLEDGMDIMIGTSARIGETVALRRMDVDVTTNPPTVLINGTLTQTRQNGLSRKASPKRERQTRRVALPSFAAAAVRRRLAAAEKGPGSYLFATQSGRPYSVSNYERLLRTFVDDNEQALGEAGIAVDQFSSHIFRRTAATLVEAVAGITLASRLLGHANEAITRASYVVTAEQVDPATAVILDAALRMNGAD
jgi:integrase